MTQPQFLGVHSATIDAEGRIQLPAPLRDEVNVRQPEFRFMATLEADGSLCLRSQSAFAEWAALLQARPARDQKDRTTLLTVAAFSGPVKCDKQGRIRVPDALLNLAGIDRGNADAREVILVGGFQEVRLWSPGGWTEFALEARKGLGQGLDALLAPEGLRQMAPVSPPGTFPEGLPPRAPSAQE